MALQIENIDELIQKIDAYLKTVVSEKRYNHSVRTAETAAFMCTLFNIPQKIGYLAGISHDMCKEFSAEDLFRLVEFDKKPITTIEMQKPSLLHGRAAAVLLEQKFNVSDSDIKEAVANHTFAGANLCDLGKILFVADKIEPGRPQSTDEYRQNLFSKTLDELTLSVLQENIDYLEKRGKVVANVSYILRDQLLAAIGVNKNETK